MAVRFSKMDSLKHTGSENNETPALFQRRTTFRPRPSLARPWEFWAYAIAHIFKFALTKFCRITNAEMKFALLNPIALNANRGKARHFPPPGACISAGTFAT